MKKLGIGMIGMGTVGKEVYRLIQNASDELEIDLRKIAVRDLKRDRGVEVPEGVLCDDWRQVIADPEVDMVVELMGGTTVAGDVLRESLRQGKGVVTANKALLAGAWEELFELCGKFRVPLRFEAAVAGGIPIIRTLREALVAARIDDCYAILNGTTNYILSAMEEGEERDDALKQAQEKGFAEADPTLDLNGQDCAHKLRILAALAFGLSPKIDIFVEGIEKLETVDLKYAHTLGMTIKLLAVAVRREGEGVDIRVHPALIPFEHPLSAVRKEFNAVYLSGKVCGPLLLYGLGAGGAPTAGAVFSDILSVSRVLRGASSSPFPFTPSAVELFSFCKTKNCYYFRFGVKDQPGVLGTITKILGEFGISIERVNQWGTNGSGGVNVMIVTHPCLESCVQQVIEQIDSLSVVISPTVVVRALPELGALVSLKGKENGS